MSRSKSAPRSATMTMRCERQLREVSYVRDGLPGLLPLPPGAEDFPQKLKDGSVDPLALRR